MARKSPNIFGFCLLVLCLSIFFLHAYADTVFIDGKEVRINTDEPALYQYIDIQDPNFEWHEIGLIKNDSEKRLEYWLVEFTSLMWLTPHEVSRSLWKHNLTIIKPYEIEIPDVATLYITGCLQEAEKCQSDQIGTIEEIAKKAKVVLASLTQIPNSRMVFADDPLQKDRTEDAIVAYTWKRLIYNPTRPDFSVYLPMVCFSFIYSLYSLISFINTDKILR